MALVPPSAGSQVMVKHLPRRCWGFRRNAWCVPPSPSVIPTRRHAVLAPNERRHANLCPILCMRSAIVKRKRIYNMTSPIPDMYDRLELLQQYRHIAIVGVSADPYRPSHFVAIYLQAEGYDIIPINPNYAGQTLLGKRVYATLTEAKAAGEQIEVVDVFRR